jgi:hypothetical protein
LLADRLRSAGGSALLSKLGEWAQSQSLVVHSTPGWLTAFARARPELFSLRLFNTAWWMELTQPGAHVSKAPPPAGRPPTFKLRPGLTVAAFEAHVVRLLPKKGGRTELGTLGIALLPLLVLEGTSHGWLKPFLAARPHLFTLSVEKRGANYVCVAPTALAALGDALEPPEADAPLPQPRAQPVALPPAPPLVQPVALPPAPPLVQPVALPPAPMRAAAQPPDPLLSFLPPPPQLDPFDALTAARFAAVPAPTPYAPPPAESAPLLAGRRQPPPYRPPALGAPAAGGASLLPPMVQSLLPPA